MVRTVRKPINRIKINSVSPFACSALLVLMILGLAACGGGGGGGSNNSDNDTPLPDDKKNNKYSKIDVFGNTIPDDSQNWSCVLDRETGLMWEVKTNDGGLRDKDWVYTAYISEGDNGNGICNETKTCNVVKFKKMVNEQSLCGYKDWRLPSVTDLESLWDENKARPPFIEVDFFKNTSIKNQYWTDPETNFRRVWWVDFNKINSAYTPHKDIQMHVRLVRDW